MGIVIQAYLGVQSTVTLHIEFENRMSASSTSKFTVVNIFSALSVFLSVREYTVSVELESFYLVILSFQFHLFSAQAFFFINKTTIDKKK